MTGVDVIAPCYNYGRFLEQCAASVLQQAGVEVRLLIIDDASPDGSAWEARRLAAEDSRIQLILHKQNQGHIATYNEGLAWAEQDYVLLLSTDDMLAPGALGRAVALMEAQPDVAFVYGCAAPFRNEDELAQARRLPAAPEVGVTPGLEFVRRLCHRPINLVETATAVVRTAVQKRAGGYRPELPHAGDLEMWLRCAAHGDVGEIGALQAFVRLHGANMRETYSGSEFLRDYRQRGDAFRWFFEHASLPGGEGLYELAMGSLARDLLWEASKAVEQGEGCDEMVKLALGLSPRVRRTGQYRRLAVKRALHGALGSLRPPAPPRRTGVA